MKINKLEFEWDENKAVSNFQKHGISFDEAKLVFKDYSAYIFDDEKHSSHEKRELIIGYSKQDKLLIACFTMRNNKIRIINIRLTNKDEKRKYEKNRLK